MTPHRPPLRAHGTRACSLPDVPPKVDGASFAVFFRGNESALMVVGSAIQRGSRFLARIKRVLSFS